MLTLDEVFGLPPAEPAPEPPTPPAPKSFTFDALTTIGEHAKKVADQTEVVRALESEVYKFESENLTVVRAHNALHSKLHAARRVLAEKQTEALTEIGWKVRK